MKQQELNQEIHALLVNSEGKDLGAFWTLQCSGEEGARHDMSFKYFGNNTGLSYHHLPSPGVKRSSTN